MVTLYLPAIWPGHRGRLTHSNCSAPGISGNQAVDYLHCHRDLLGTGFEGY